MFLVEKRKIDINGRIQLPSAMREELGLRDGDEIIVILKDETITIAKQDSKITQFAFMYEGKE